MSSNPQFHLSTSITFFYLAASLFYFLIGLFFFWLSAVRLNAVDNVSVATAKETK